MNWMKRVKETHKYHIDKLTDNSSWRVVDTAKSLKRSIGGISEDLMIASWLFTHSRELEKCDSIKEALEFIRHKKHEQRMRRAC